MILEERFLQTREQIPIHLIGRRNVVDDDARSVAVQELSQIDLAVTDVEGKGRHDSKAGELKDVSEYGNGTRARIQMATTPRDAPL